MSQTAQEEYVDTVEQESQADTDQDSQGQTNPDPQTLQEQQEEELTKNQDTQQKQLNEEQKIVDQNTANLIQSQDNNHNEEKDIVQVQQGEIFANPQRHSLENQFLRDQFQGSSGSAPILEKFDSRSSIISKLYSGELQYFQTKQEGAVDGMDEMLWRGEERVFAIFSSAGKPVFSSIGDETAIARITAILSAIMANFSADGERLQYVKAGRYTVVFSEFECFQLVAASSGGEPPETLKLQLELLHGQIVSLVTNAVERMFERNPAYDVRTLLKGTSGLLKTLLNGFSYSPAYFLGAYEPLMLSQRVIEEVNGMLRKAAKSADALYALLLAGDQVVAKVDMKQAMHPNDLLLLSNFVQANDSFRQHHLNDLTPNNNNGQSTSAANATHDHESYSSFSPVCLPHFNPNLFLHAFIYFLDHVLGISLVMVSGNQNSFYEMAESGKILQQQLQQSGYLRLVQECTASSERRYIQIETLPVSVGGGPSKSTPLLHFIFRRTTRRQFYRALPLVPEMRDEKSQRKLNSFYSRVNAMLRQGNMREVWWAESEWAVLAIQDEGLDEIYACFDRCVLKGDALRYAISLLQYMKTTTEVQ
eukprot:TRINITY_DN4488_c0_g2_i2.p1 TRINITY_DN4488_c0_g2~~TRINITY_DN4488_c0_g2_i2.p1  ORF type:complete len:591 (+),score=69.61 TRINITY_DN4488_c0_g2_i2:120-1892(+)